MYIHPKGIIWSYETVPFYPIEWNIGEYNTENQSGLNEIKDQLRSLVRDLLYTYIFYCMYCKVQYVVQLLDSKFDLARKKTAVIQNTSLWVRGEVIVNSSTKEIPRSRDNVTRVSKPYEQVKTVSRTFSFSRW